MAVWEPLPFTAGRRSITAFPRYSRVDRRGNENIEKPDGKTRDETCFQCSASSPHGRRFRAVPINRAIETNVPSRAYFAATDVCATAHGYVTLSPRAPTLPDFPVIPIALGNTAISQRRTGNCRFNQDHRAYPRSNNGRETGTRDIKLLFA